MSSASTRELSLDFDRAIALSEHSPTPRFVVANMNSWNFSKGAFMDAHDSPGERKASIVSIESRPRTSHGTQGTHGILNRPKRQSFSRPLTSDGPRRFEPVPPPPRLPPNFSPRSAPLAPAGPIGLALGSPLAPAHDMLSMNGPASAPFERTSKPLTPSPSLKSPTPTQEQQAKPKRWRSMGGLFRKKAPATPPPPPEPAKKVETSPKSDESERASGGRRSVSRRMSFGSGLRTKAKADAQELPPMPPKLELGRVVSKESIRRPNTSSKDSSVTTAPRLDRAPSKESSRRPNTSNDSSDVPTPRLELPDGDDKPTLDVDIPKTKLDRYSVMFSDFLSKSFDDIEVDTDESKQLEAQLQIPKPQETKVARERSAQQSHSDSSLQERRKPPTEKLSPLNMHRISTTLTFHREPITPKSAPSVHAPQSAAPSFPPPPPPQPLSAPAIDRNLLTARASAYSLFPRTDSSPLESNSHPFSAENQGHDEHALPVLKTEDFSKSSEALHPLRSSSVFPSEPDTPRKAITRRPVKQPESFPPSPPLSSAESPSVGTVQTLASPSFRSARSSAYSSGISSSISHDESDFPSGVEIHVQDEDAGTFDYSRLMSPPQSTNAANQLADEQESVDSPSRSSAIGDSPLLGMARSVSLSYRHERPRFLRTSRHPSDETDESSARKDSINEVRASARTPTFVHVDDSDLFEDEESWIRRRSMWGVMEDA